MFYNIKLFKHLFVYFQAIPHYGILARSEVGLLVHYEETSTPVQVTQIPGSRLKTPSYPIWITCAKGHYGILFNTNRELLRNHLAERRYIKTIHIL